MQFQQNNRLQDLGLCCKNQTVQDQQVLLHFKDFSFFVVSCYKSCWSLLSAESKIMLKLTNHLCGADQPAEVVLSQLEHLFRSDLPLFYYEVISF